MEHNIPFGFEQTIPSDRMVSLLASMVPAGSRVMEIGCGSGKLASALAQKCQDVVGVDIQGVIGLEALPGNVTVVRADGCRYDSGEKFDAIVVSFGAEVVYAVWVKQLRIGGLLIVPLQNGSCCSIQLFQKNAMGELDLLDVPAYASFTNEVH